jgi:hypothetical protein
VEGIIMKKKCVIILLPCILFLICTLFITGCSTKPIFNSKNEVKDYVKNVYGKEFKLVKEENHSYTFRNEEGLSFTATSYSQNVSFDASETCFYEENFYTDYTESVLLFHADEIKELLNKYDLEVDTNENMYYRVYIKDSIQIEQAAKLIVELDKILAYKFNNNRIPKKMSGYEAQALTICVNMEDTELLSLDLSSDEDRRLDYELVNMGIEEAYVDCIKAGEIDGKIDTELWAKYPADTIKPVYYNGEPLSIEFDDYARDYEDTYTLHYNSYIGTYMMSYLDPCQDFKDFPYSYSGVGTFKHLVELLGGTYSCDDWKAIWEIDGNIWKATLHTKKKDGDSYSYDYLEVSRNGVLLDLTEGFGGNGTISGRKYTLEDLELMLDVEIEIDQTNMAAYMNKNN